MPVSKKMTAKEIEQDKAVKELRKLVKPGTTLRTIRRHVSRSGMSRSISVVKVDRSGDAYELDYLIAKALDMRFDHKNGGLKIGGAGMDMGFAIVYRLSDKLYGYSSSRGYKCLGDRCPSNAHVNDYKSPRGKGVRHNDGYAISQRWL